MIKTASCGIAPGSHLVIDVMEPPSSPALRVAKPSTSRTSEARHHAERAEALASHLDFLWRFACRMGLGSATAEDFAQEAFVIALSRLDAIESGKERSYLLSVVMNMIRRERVRNRRHEELSTEPASAERDGPDHVLDDKRARELLDQSLEVLDDDLRAVFVLHEIEEETMAVIAQVLDIAPGTVASRLRRAREEWKRATERLKRQWKGSVQS